MTLISGNSNNATWQTTVTIPAGRPSEVFGFFDIIINDVVNNQFSTYNPVAPDITIINTSRSARRSKSVGEPSGEPTSTPAGVPPRTSTEHNR